MSVWERVRDGMRRMRAGTGWLVQDIDSGTTTFVPDPDGVWVLPGAEAQAEPEQAPMPEPTADEVRAQRIREVLDVAGVGATYDVKRGAAGVRFADSCSILMWPAASTSTLWVVRSGVIQPGPWTEADVDDLIALGMRTATQRQERERAKYLAEQQAKAAAERERAEAAWAAWKAGGGA